MKLFYTIHNALNGGNENFSNYRNDPKPKTNIWFAYLLSLIIYLVLVVFVGKWIWNNVLVNLVSGVNKIKNPVDILWLHILFSLLLGTM